MLCWMCGKIQLDRIRNDNIRERFMVAPMIEKMVDTRLRTIRKDLEINELKKDMFFFFFFIKHN